jgi:circadian clock protein KaiC
VRGATEFNEPGLFVAFEETDEELTQNMASLGFDLNDLRERGKLDIDYVEVERGQLEEAGEYDLDGLFIRLGCAIDAIGARRVVLDTLEVLFSTLPNEAILRLELRRLFRWLKDKGVTAVITAERGEGAFTRHGLEEYVSDCVIVLDHRIQQQVSTRRLRIVKYRGSTHGANEYPFLITERGICILPITSLGLSHATSRERVSTGIPALDEMLGGGLYRGSSTLVSGMAGTGKTSIVAHAAEAACERGERCLYFAFEESPDQIHRNMESIGINLQRWVERGQLQFHAARPTLYGLESHLAVIQQQLQEFQPQVVVLDPITNFTSAGAPHEVKAMLMRLIDVLKLQQITAVFTSLTSGGADPEHTEAEVSSLMDTWLLLKTVASAGERRRTLYVLKSRGTDHSHQLREYSLSAQGVQLLDVYRSGEENRQDV